LINDDEHIALFLAYENLAIGARDGLGVSPFEFGPVADALAERGRGRRRGHRSRPAGRRPEVGTPRRCRGRHRAPQLL
jgi:hypothetical protein